jgi:dihydropteroate synthase
MGGADILRVHDVKEAKEAVKLVEQLKITMAEVN